MFAWILSSIWTLLTEYTLWVSIVSISLYLLFKIDADIPLLLYAKFGKSAKVLNGQVIWITGASSGLGAELAVLLAKNGSKLVLSATREGHLEQVKSRCLAANTELSKNDVLVLPMDMRDTEGHRDKMNKVLEHFGHLDILVSNAGQNQIGLAHETELAVDKNVFEINYFGAINLTKLVVNEWTSKGQKGHIAVTSSVGGALPIATMASYVATKHALHGFFECLRLELFCRNITISMVCPGPLGNDFSANSLTTKLGEKFNESHFDWFQSAVTSSERCAYLYSVVLANKLSHAYIVFFPAIFGVYLGLWFPNVNRWIAMRVFSENLLRKLTTGKFF